jgi:hypothetical protein
MTCDICGGSKLIILPVRRPLSVTTDSTLLATEPMSREYSCPECSHGGPVSRLHVEQMTAMQDERTTDMVAVRRSMDREAAAKMAEAILDAGMIRSEERQIEEFGRPVIEVRYWLGVVAPRHVATLDERVRENDREVAREVASRAAGKIERWNIHGTDHEIPKHVALSMVGEATHDVLEKRAGWSAKA